MYFVLWKIISQNIILHSADAVKRHSQYSTFLSQISIFLKETLYYLWVQVSCISCHRSAFFIDTAVIFLNIKVVTGLLVTDRDGNQAPVPVEKRFEIAQSTGIVYLQAYQILLSMVVWLSDICADILSVSASKLLETRSNVGEEETAESVASFHGEE